MDMTMRETLETKQAEKAFSATLVGILLLILPMWGGMAMLVGSAVGLVAYAVLFRDRLRSRGWLKIVVPMTAAAVTGAAIAIALSWEHWR
jgi:hypothetical protein